MVKDITELAKRLKILRNSVPIHIVSDKTGIPKDYIERLEDGLKITSPSPHALWKLSQYYSGDYIELMILGGCIIKKPFKKCASCGLSYEDDKGYGCTCDNCDKRVGDAFS